jgi:hypothetical protein
VEDKSGQRGWCENGELCFYTHEKPADCAPICLTGLVFHFSPQPAHWHHYGFLFKVFKVPMLMHIKDPGKKQKKMFFGKVFQKLGDRWLSQIVEK